MKEIQLTQEQIALVDDEDFENLNQHKWFAQYDPINRCFYACRDVSYKRVYMSREILKCPKSYQVDHKDHNTLNNQRHNIRTCTSQENSRNRKPDKATSIYKGVGWHNQNQKWRARIHTKDIFDQSVAILLGLFNSEEEAAKVYDAAALKEFGEFAYLNFPKEK